NGEVRGVRGHRFFERDAGGVGSVGVGVASSGDAARDDIGAVVDEDEVGFGAATVNADFHFGVGGRGGQKGLHRGHKRRHRGHGGRHRVCSVLSVNPLVSSV